MKNLWDSIVRTIVPIVVSTVLVWVVGLGVEVDPEFEASLSGVLFATFNIVYYVGVRLLEVYVSPKFGWLLGLASKPNYPDTPVSPEITE